MMPIAALVRTSALLVALVLTVGSVPPARVAAAESPVCVEGFDIVEGTSLFAPSAVLTTSPSSALIAGSGRTAPGQWSARIRRFDEAGWHTILTRAPKSDNGLMALDGNPSKGRWAVGYKRATTEMVPYSLRQTSNGSWKEAWVPRAGSEAAALTDVAVRRRNAVWAVGFRLDGAGTHRPHVVRWDGKRWKTMGPPIATYERGLLSAVSSTASGGTWIGGSLTRALVERPYLARRKNGQWKRVALPSMGAGSITSVMVHGKQAGWAVGYRASAGVMRAFVLRWDGHTWTKKTPPDMPAETIFFDVGLDAGDVVLTGSTWDADAGRMRPIVARRQGDRWAVHELKGFAGDAAMAEIDGGRSTRGFLAARALPDGGLVRTCEGTGVGVATRKATRADRRTELAGSDEHELHAAEALPAPRLGLAAAPALKTSPRSAAAVSIVDRASAAGLPTAGHTYGAVVRDFDGNGQKDLFIGGHGDRAVLHLNEGGTFAPAPVEFTIADRHGCTATDVDGSGLPDLYCTFGGGRGFGLKANELWLDPGGPNPRLAPDAGGARELLGRGRVATVFDYDDDGRKDLVVTQMPNRVDGLPSLNRIFRWVGPGRYSLVRDSGIGPAIGAREVDTGDFDRDGRTDLLLVTYDAKIKGPLSSIRLYRNTPNGLKDVRVARGIKTIGERDAELVGLDGDDRLDLVQLSANRIRVSLQRNGKFVKVWERKVSNARALAVGDADGDGDNDIFILRQKPTSTDNDLILFNNGSGRGYAAVEAPSRQGGSADQVYPVDHDGNGMVDFLVLNGRSSELGPIQLISFYAR